MLNVKPPVVATFSIVGYDPKREEWGVAVQSKFLGVGPVVPWAKANVGAIATQARANTSYGPNGLKLLEQGLAAREVVERLTKADENRSVRQLAVVDSRGRSAAFTGSECHDWAGHVTGPNYSCQGNILAGPAVVEAMAKAFEDSSGDLADRLVAALVAGQEAGGDRRGRESAALLVAKEKGGYGEFNDRYIDIRVDDHLRPIAELKRILELYRFFFLPEKPESLRYEGTLLFDLQGLLNELGYYEGPLDGETDVLGEVKRFARDSGLEELVRNDGRISTKLISKMIDKVY